MVVKIFSQQFDLINCKCKYGVTLGSVQRSTACTVPVQCTVECDPLSRDLGKSQPCATGHQAAKQCPDCPGPEPSPGWENLENLATCSEPLANMPCPGYRNIFAGKLHLLRRNPDTKSELIMSLSGHSPRAKCERDIMTF